MLEIKNLTKIYRTKGGNDVLALDNVSINFEETGLVFLLGKSGSGKSTLLNLAGGLDEPTSGEVVVMGKSSRDFTGSDFDSYRNTFIGFIFQEYNVLNEFSVEDNIALALELQGKPKDREKIAGILRDVELEAFAKRKPNTLSGGQKQRIAIARALIKDPQIIMADEPTGALDSATGKQVFDTLKKLSETRLVIVVSHDREFAETYGDRIVELKDGRIISDESKTKTSPKQLDDNITAIGENTIAIRHGAELTEANFKTIRAFLKESGGDIILTRGEREIEDFRRAARIDVNGDREHFETTDTNSLAIRDYDGTKTKFIRSKLPASKAIKIGASGLKLKPIRLIFTIFLSFVAFVMFGLFSTLMVYNGTEVLVNSFAENPPGYLMVSKNYRETVTYYDSYYGRDETYTRSNQAKFTPEEVTELGGETAFGAYGAKLSGFNNVSVSTKYTDYYTPSVYFVATLSENSPVRNKITGQYPQSADEIVVSSYFVECLINSTYTKVDENGNQSDKRITSANDLIGEYLVYNKDLFKVSGVFDSGAVDSKYDDIKDGTNRNYLLEMTYGSYLKESMHLTAFVTESFLTEHSNLIEGYSGSIDYFDYVRDIYFLFAGLNEDGDVFASYGSDSIKVFDPSSKIQLPVTFFNGQKTALDDKELIVSEGFLSAITSVEEFYSGALFGVENMSEEKQKQFNEDVENYYNAIKFYFDFDEASASPAERAEARDCMISFLKKYWDFKAPLSVMSGDTRMLSSMSDYTIVGIYSGSDQDGFYCSQSFYDNADIDYAWGTSETKYVPEEDAVYSYLIIPFEMSRTEFQTFATKSIGEKNINAQTDVFYELNNELYYSVTTVNELVHELSTVFLIVGIVLALFAALLLFNFISVSISYKKKEIGILRAVGARGLDVFKIFFAESGIIVGICLLLSLVGSIVLTSVINGIIKAQLGLSVTLFVFGIVPIVMMIGIALVVAVLATLLPVYLAARKKPVDSIRAL